MAFNSQFNTFQEFLQHQAESDPLSKAVNSLLGKLTGSALTAAEREANEFTASQNREAMAFEEKMAQKQMDFQAEQSATQFQRGVADMKAAGLNPALAYGQGGASAMSGASASGSAGSSVTPSAPASLSEILQLATIKPTIRNLEAQARATNAEAALKETDVASRDKLNQATLGKLNKEIDSIEESIARSKFERGDRWKVESALMYAQARLAEGQFKMLGVQREIQEWTRDFIKKFGMTPELAGQLAGAVASFGRSFVDIFLGRYFAKGLVPGSRRGAVRPR